jgi:hypothetical protein
VEMRHIFFSQKSSMSRNELIFCIIHKEEV